MVEALATHKLGDDIDKRGNLLKEIAEGEGLEDAIWKLDEQRQAEVLPYTDLRQKIDDLPKFEKNEINKLISDFIYQYPSEERVKLQENGIVQHMFGSSRPLSFWQNCKFNTPDGKFEEYLNNRIRPAVEGMLSDLNK